ncbi:MAG: hypothetical protein M3303_03390, partial [Gemmatimonadota bacterium]|nr:hypothetical protein [Gemmatimonadota bacterium]
MGAALIWLAACSSDRLTGPNTPRDVPASVAFDLIDPTPPDLTPSTLKSFPEEKETFPILVENECTGELVQGTGTSRFQIDFDDKTFHLVVHQRFIFDGNGVTNDAFRTATGTTYSGSGEDNYETNSNGATHGEETQTLNFRINATGYPLGESADDLRM